jgi:hypothetical protein
MLSRKAKEKKVNDFLADEYLVIDKRMADLIYKEMGLDKPVYSNIKL